MARVQHFFPLADPYATADVCHHAGGIKFLLECQVKKLHVIHVNFTFKKVGCLQLLSNYPVKMGMYHVIFTSYMKTYKLLECHKKVLTNAYYN